MYDIGVLLFSSALIFLFSISSSIWDLEKQKKTVFAAYRPDDVNIYQDKGGLGYFQSPLDFNVGNQPVRTGLEDLSLEELEELLKKTK